MSVKLIKTKDLAKQLGFPHDAMVKVAIKHGLIIACGRSKSVREDEIDDLIEACRVKPKAPVPHKPKEMGQKPSKALAALNAVMNARKE